MGLRKKKKEQTLEEMREEYRRAMEWHNRPTELKGRVVDPATIPSTFGEKVMDGLGVLRDIFLTPFIWIFGVLALVCRVGMYVGVCTFLYGGYRVYKSVSTGSGFVAALCGEWKYLLLPFAAALLYFIFEECRDYCSDHSMFLG